MRALRWLWEWMNSWKMGGSEHYFPVLPCKMLFPRGFGKLPSSHQVVEEPLPPSEPPSLLSQDRAVSMLQQKGHESEQQEMGGSLKTCSPRLDAAFVTSNLQSAKRTPHGPSEDSNDLYRGPCGSAYLEGPMLTPTNWTVTIHPIVTFLE